MRQSIIVCVAVIAGTLANAGAAFGAEAAPLYGGVAVVDITPPTGYRMSGYFSERLSTGTHDPLHAKAIVFQQGDVKAALVFCDLIGIARDVSAEARKLASGKTGIPAANIMVAATHSHTGPLYFGALRQYFHNAQVAAHGRDPLEAVDYPAALIDGIAEAVVQAHAALRPVRLDAGVAPQQGLSFNRRFHMKDGSVRFNPGKMNPNIVRPAGPIDPDVGMLMLRGGDNAPIAMLSVFALHLDTVGGTQYSADYPHHLEQSLRGVFGQGFVSLFGTGTCGDINHIDVSNKLPQKGQIEAKRIGDRLAETVKAQVPRLGRVASPALAVGRAVVTAPLQQYTREQIEHAQDLMAHVGDSKVAFLQRVEAAKIMALQLRGGRTIDLETQVFRLSDDVAVVALPGEVFVDLGLAIKHASPFKTTMVIELANDAPGYVPTKKAFEEGSYETVNSRVQSGGGEMMADAAAHLLRQLHDDTP